jgi:DNA-binding transcriptional regulator WhiA
MNLDSKVIDLYKNGLSLSEISRKYNCSRQSITRYLIKYNEFNPENKIRQRTNIDKNQYKVLTKEMVYFLGLLWSDGFLSKTKNGGYTVGLKLLETDMDKIKFIFDKLGPYSYRKLNLEGRKEVAILAYHSKDFFNFLLKNDYDKKSKDSADKILSIIPDSLKSYFFRGIIDGDGYIGIRNDNTFSLVIAGSYNQSWKYLEDLFKKFKLKYTVKNIITKKGHRHSVISIFNFRDILIFLDYVYRVHDGIYYPRKFEKYLKIKNLMKKHYK